MSPHLQLLAGRVGCQVVQQATDKGAQLQQLLRQQCVAASVAQQAQRELAEQRPGGPLQQVPQRPLLPVPLPQVCRALALLLPERQHKATWAAGGRC